MQSNQPVGESIPANPPFSVFNNPQYVAEGVSLLLLGILLGSLAGITAYKKYKVETRKKRIQTLERLWQLNIKEQSH